MNSIRSKTTLLTVIAIVVTMTVAMLLGVFSIKNLGSSSSDQMLLLLCETGEKNLDAYFKSVEQSVEIVSDFLEEDLDGLSEPALSGHVERARSIFEKTIARTQGVLTYYYRIDPEISDTVKGFWYVSEGEEGFAEHEVTDISHYDTDDVSQLTWFTVPKHSGRPVWLSPYMTDNLDVRVVSYSVPITWNGRFVGAAGIEIDYSTIAEQVDNIKLYDNGYAFLTDAEGKLIYHPLIDVAVLTEETMPELPAGLLSEGTSVRYSYGGVDKQAVWLPLSNGMRLMVSVPVSEINSGWKQLTNEVFAVSVLLLIVFVILTLRFTGQITEPLQELTEAAKQVNAGNYEVELSYEGSDEVGILTHAFRELIDHLKVYISDLNSLAYADALTSVRNKGAFDIYMRKLQARLDDPKDRPAFAVGVFDCDDLKAINDRYGHDKGDIYLRQSSSLICHVFVHSPVFRTGGDEFAVILMNEDYQRREELIRSFAERSEASCRENGEQWNQVRVAMGVAVFDGQSDRTAEDVLHRADRLMYADKRSRKATR